MYYHVYMSCDLYDTHLTARTPLTVRTGRNRTHIYRHPRPIAVICKDRTQDALIVHDFSAHTLAAGTGIRIALIVLKNHPRPLTKRLPARMGNHIRRAIFNFIFRSLCPIYGINTTNIAHCSIPMRCTRKMFAVAEEAISVDQCSVENRFACTARRATAKKRHLIVSTGTGGGNMYMSQFHFLLVLFMGPLLSTIPATGQMVELEPEFLAPLENHTVTQGREVSFTCVVNHLSSYKVAWIKSDTKAILAIHTHMVAQNPRFSVTHNGHNTWKLHVSNVQKNDSGTYMCQINTDPMRSQMGNLEVVIPPDILNDNESSEGGGVAIEGGNVRLRCYATGIPEPTVMWRREDSRNLILRYDGGREKQVLRSYDGDTLSLNNIQRTDMGPYLCIASNGVPPSVSKRFIVRVHFHPLIRVSNQLVAAPITSDVLVQCYVEASPKAMNHWARDSGEKLIPSDKYATEETQLNDYSLLMNLTIRSLGPRDFGGYVCTSSNALGKAEGVVRLQELQLAVKTTTTTAPPKFADTKARKPVFAKDTKPKKYNKRPSKGGARRGGTDDDEDTTGRETTTALTAPESSRTPGYVYTQQPGGVTRSPPWILHHNAALMPMMGQSVLLITMLLLCQVAW